MLLGSTRRASDLPDEKKQRVLVPGACIEDQQVRKSEIRFDLPRLSRRPTLHGGARLSFHAGRLSVEALAEAAERGDLVELAIMLNKRVDPDMREEGGRTLS